MTMPMIKKILVTDNNDILGSSIALHLFRQGFCVCRTCDVDLAKNAILAAKKTDQPFDLVVSDISMPSRIEISFIKWLHAHHPEVGILVVSGLGSADLLDTLLRPDHDSFRQKPVLPNEIVAAILYIEAKKQERFEQRAMTQNPGEVLSLECHSEEERFEFPTTPKRQHYG